MATKSIVRLFALYLVALFFIFSAFERSASSMEADQCVDYSKDPAGCQPSTFKTPFEQMPTGRVNRLGQPDASSSEQDARAGVALLEKQLHLFRNFDHLHWVPLIPSIKDPATGAWKGGDLDGEGTGRGFGMSGNCIFVGHNTGPGVVHPMTVLKIQPNPDKQPPVIVGEIPVPSQLDARRGIDDKEIRGVTYQTAGGDRMVLVRLVEDNIETYQIDVNTCLPVASSTMYEGPGQPHEFFLWHDPTNQKRVLVYVTMSGAGSPDPQRPGMTLPAMSVFAATDEDTGDLLPKPRTLANFSLHEVGGPPVSEKPDGTGLFSDGRYADYRNLRTRRDQPGEFNTGESNRLHSLSVSDDGERVYMAGGTTGFYILNSEAIAHGRDSELAGGQAGCNQWSTNVLANGAIDASKLAQVSRDCAHMVANDDPGLKALLESNVPVEVKTQRYLGILTRSRFDVYPPINDSVGVHSAVLVPNRPAQVNGNAKGRPAYAFLTSENLGVCPSAYARVLSVEVEATPVMVGAFAVPGTNVQDCLVQPVLPQPLIHSHNPTVFKNLVFLGWYSHGLRVIDISNPQMPREVGYAVTTPNPGTRGYAVLKDGLFYWADTKTGLHVARYTGPRREELPGPGSGLYDSNSSSPHR